MKFNLLIFTLKLNMALESSNLLRNSCYNLQSYLSKRFRNKITLPDGIPSTSYEYIQLIESRLICPPPLIRATNDPERQRRTEEMMSYSMKSSSILRILFKLSIFFYFHYFLLI